MDYRDYCKRLSHEIEVRRADNSRLRRLLVRQRLSDVRRLPPECRKRAEDELKERLRVIAEAERAGDHALANALACAFAKMPLLRFRSHRRAGVRALKQSPFRDLVRDLPNNPGPRKGSSKRKSKLVADRLAQLQKEIAGLSLWMAECHRSDRALIKKLWMRGRVVDIPERTLQRDIAELRRTSR